MVSICDVHPTVQNPKNPPLVEGEPFALNRMHGKVRRNGYHKERNEAPPRNTGICYA